MHVCMSLCTLGLFCSRPTRRQRCLARCPLFRTVAEHLTTTTNQPTKQPTKPGLHGTSRRRQPGDAARALRQPPRLPPPRRGQRSPRGDPSDERAGRRDLETGPHAELRRRQRHAARRRRRRCRKRRYRRRSGGGERGRWRRWGRAAPAAAAPPPVGGAEGGHGVRRCEGHAPPARERLLARRAQAQECAGVCVYHVYHACASCVCIMCM